MQVYPRVTPLGLPGHGLETRVRPVRQGVDGVMAYHSLRSDCLWLACTHALAR